MCFVNVQLSLHENVVFFVWAMPRILYLSCGIPFPVWMPGIISGLMFNISCGVDVMVRSHQQKFQVIFQGKGRGANFLSCLHFLDHLHF